jgi:hypothetical protein
VRRRPKIRPRVLTDAFCDGWLADSYAEEPEQQALDPNALAKRAVGIDENRRTSGARLKRLGYGDI